MEFEWDEAKRVTNLEKHGIDFIGAAARSRTREASSIDRVAATEEKSAAFWWENRRAA